MEVLTFPSLLNSIPFHMTKPLYPNSTTPLKSTNSLHAFSVTNSITETREPDNKPPVNPVYKPTSSNRPLRTPHSGYHFDGSTRKFFEGWYFKVSIPECRQSFCFMYSVENPAFRRRLSRLEEVQHGPRFTGVGAQILGADDKYICQYQEESENFWGNMSAIFIALLLIVLSLTLRP
ncbi:hypothetical protein Leryth_003540 [Lithospermum erythrorhizon]|nr:hypothetical protein Leryth_003540 [Lithospermum erythrorhizon]